MKLRHRVTVGAALTAAVGGLTFVGSASARPSAPQAAGPAVKTPLHHGGESKVAANRRVVEAFVRDVLSEHHGDHAARYMNPEMTWHGGTVGTVVGRDYVAGLMTSLVTAIPDMHPTVVDVIGQGDEVVTREVVTGTQKGPVLGIPASGRALRWDAVDVYRLRNGKISEMWAAEDFTALLNDTGTFKAPWIQ